MGELKDSHVCLKDKREPQGFCFTIRQYISRYLFNISRYLFKYLETLSASSFKSIKDKAECIHCPLASVNLASNPFITQTAFIFNFLGPKMTREANIFK